MKRGKVVLFVFVILAALISFYFDSEIVRSVSVIRNEILTDIFLSMTLASFGIIVLFFLTSLFLWRDHKRKWILPLWLTLGFSALISFLLKLIVPRLRPFQTGVVATFPVLATNSHLTWNSSFPSFQAMMAFCALPILSKEFPKFKYIWMIFAVLIAFSRVYFGLHFLSDVLLGGLIGYLLGAIIVKIEEKSKFGEKIYKKIKKILKI